MKLLAESFNIIIDASSAAFAHMPDWDFKPAPDKWSAKEVLGHLIDSAQNNIQRFVRGTYEENFKIVYAQNEWVKYQHYNLAPVNEIVQLWILLNKQIVRIWQHYPPERLQITSDIGVAEPEIITILQNAEGYIQHLNHHLAQIKQLAASRAE